MEIVDLSSPTSTCKTPPNFPLKVRGSVGGLCNNTTPIICGGFDGKNYRSECFTLNQNTWIPAQSMSVPRKTASITKYPSTEDLIVIGGDNYGPEYLSTLEVYGPTGWVSADVQLPEGLTWGCAITVNETTILLTGGSMNDSDYNVSAKTFWFNIIDAKWSSGPTLNTARRSHGCGKIYDSKQGAFLIVSGGMGIREQAFTINSTEILKPGSNEWKEGPTLPMPIDQATIVEDHARNRILLVGGCGGFVGEQGPLNKIYQLASPLTETSQWEELPQRIQIGRREQPVVFFIPDEYADCQEN